MSLKFVVGPKKSSHNSSKRLSCETLGFWCLFSEVFFTDVKIVAVQNGIGKSFGINIARVSKNAKGGVKVISIRMQDSRSVSRDA